MNHHLPLWLHSFFMTISSQSNPHPKCFKTFLLFSSQGLGKQVRNLSVTSKVYTQILPLKYVVKIKLKSAYVRHRRKPIKEAL